MPVIERPQSFPQLEVYSPLPPTLDLLPNLVWFHKGNLIDQIITTFVERASVDTIEAVVES